MFNVVLIRADNSRSIVDCVAWLGYDVHPDADYRLERVRKDLCYREFS